VGKLAEVVVSGGIDYQNVNRYYYGSKLIEFGDGDPRSLGWKSQYTQEIRFAQFLKFADFDRKMVLDVGCGMGHFQKWLYEQGVCLKRYIGVDLIDYGWPSGEYYVGDFLSLDLPEVDIAVQSGIFNLPVLEWKLITKLTVEKMCEHASVVLFNMDEHPMFPARQQSIWVEFAASFGDVAVQTGYLDNDYTVAIYT
jgi:hypothetical protein